MSEKREIKKIIEPSVRQASVTSEEEMQSSSEPVSRRPSSDSSTNQSSHMGESSSSVAATTARADITESSMAGAAAIAEIDVAGFAVSGPAIQSRLSSAKSAFSRFVRRSSQSPTKNTVPDQSPQKSSLTVRSLLGSATSFIGQITQGGSPSKHKSPERASLVYADSECEPPPAKAPKPKKEFYCAIDTFVDSEMKRKKSGNLTDSTDFSSSEDTSSVTKSPESSSPTEETPLLKTDKTPSKEQSREKE